MQKCICLYIYIYIYEYHMLQILHWLIMSEIIYSFDSLLKNSYSQFRDKSISLVSDWNLIANNFYVLDLMRQQEINLSILKIVDIDIVD